MCEERTFTAHRASRQDLLAHLGETALIHCQGIVLGIYTSTKNPLMCIYGRVAEGLCNHEHCSAPRNPGLDDCERGKAERPNCRIETECIFHDTRCALTVWLASCARISTALRLMEEHQVAPLFIGSCTPKALEGQCHELLHQPPYRRHPRARRKSTPYFSCSALPPLPEILVRKSVNLHPLSAFMFHFTGHVL